MSWSQGNGSPITTEHVSGSSPVARRDRGTRPSGHPRRFPTLFELRAIIPLVAAAGLFSILVTRFPGFGTAAGRGGEFSVSLGTRSLTRRVVAPCVRTQPRGECRRCAEASPEITSERGARRGGPRAPAELRPAASAGRGPAGIVRKDNASYGIGQPGGEPAAIRERAARRRARRSRAPNSG